MSLSVYTGPMFSDKSSRLLREITRYSDVSEKRHALIINHVLDTRDPVKVVSSHASLYKGLSDRVDAVVANLLSEVDVDKYTIIGIDEANLFSDLVECVKEWLSKDKHIICVGLDGDYKMEKFGRISELVHLADTFVKLNAICSVCLSELTKRGQLVTPNNATPAPFTKKIKGSGFGADPALTAPVSGTESNVIDTGAYSAGSGAYSAGSESESNVIDIGGSDKYIAVCRKHHSSSSHDSGE